MRSTVSTLAVSGLLAAGLGTPASSQLAPAPPRDFFSDRSVLQFIIVTDMSVLLTDRELESPERPAEVGYQDAEGNAVWIPVQVKTRGKFRLVEDVCEFPPIRLNFRTRDVPWTVFDGQDKLKVVTHCRTSDPDYQHHVILEYLTYRLYELFTPKSFRTRLAQVTYVDASETHERITRYAFLIEDVDEMAARNNMRVVDIDGFHPLLADDFEIGVHDVFQYMIGNTDWSTVLSQNVEFLQDRDGNVTVVPFDFDWAGIVSAPYAKPAPDVPIENVRERFYMGGCRPTDHLTPVFQRFVELKDEIYDMFRNEHRLSPERREQVLAYFDDFYATITNDDLAEEHVRQACRM